MSRGSRPLVAIPARFAESSSALRFKSEVTAHQLVSAVYAAGGEPVVIHPHAPNGSADKNEVAQRLGFADAVLLPGGGDLAAHWYGGPAHPALYDVDELGLDRLDREVLDALVTKFGGGPVGVATLAVAVGEEPHTVEEVCEPFLVRAGLLARTPRGRVATEAAWRHLGHQVPRGAGILGSLPGVPQNPGSSSETLFDA